MSNLNHKETNLHWVTFYGKVAWNLGGILLSLQVVKLSALPVQYGTNRIFKSDHTD